MSILSKLFTRDRDERIESLSSTNVALQQTLAQWSGLFRRPGRYRVDVDTLEPGKVNVRSTYLGPVPREKGTGKARRVK